MFWHSEISIAQSAPFQIHLKAPTLVSLTVLPFVSLRVEFSDHHQPVIIRHQRPSETAEPQPLQLVDLGCILPQGQDVAHDILADLRWPKGGTLVLTGRLTSDSPTTCSVSIHLPLAYLNLMGSTRNPCVHRSPK